MQIYKTNYTFVQNLYFCTDKYKIEFIIYNK